VPIRSVRVPEQFPIQKYQPARLESLPGGQFAVDVHLLSISRRDLELLADQPLVRGAAVCVQAMDWLMLGEVLYCVPERGRYHALLRVRHALPSLRDLASANRRFFGQSARVPLTQNEARKYSGYN
jgi:hypothetical protein